MFNEKINEIKNAEEFKPHTVYKSVIYKWKICTKQLNNKYIIQIKFMEYKMTSIICNVISKLF